MEKEKFSNEEIVNEYRTEVNKLIKYIPWLESKRGKEVSGIYAGEDIGAHSMTVPVYDSTLLNFVKEAKQTKLMDTNYAYVYSKFRIRDYRDEWKLIEDVKLRDIHILKGILSKYVLRGMVRASVWTEAIEHQIFYKILVKLKDLIDFWDRTKAE